MLRGRVTEGSLVEFVYDADCPNVDAARAELRLAFQIAGLKPSWTEWDAGSEDAPERVRGFGSPTILVGGVDVASGAVAGGRSCRVYEWPDGSVRGVPSAEVIAKALSCRR